MSEVHLPPERSLPARRHAAARSQLERYATSRRERLGRRWHHLGVVIGLGIGLSVAGGATAGTIYLTKGPLPTEDGQIDAQRIPDFLSVVAGGETGYVPRAYIVPPSLNEPGGPLLGTIAPVYGPDLKTLIGHMYPGVGFVRLGQSPADEPCSPEWSSSNGTTSTLPCPSVTVTVPDIVGMETPTGMAAISRNGLSGDPENVHSATVPAGHVVRTSPPPGSRVPARTPILVFNSLGP